MLYAEPTRALLESFKAPHIHSRNAKDRKPWIHPSQFMKLAPEHILNRALVEADEECS